VELFADNRPARQRETCPMAARCRMPSVSAKGNNGRTTMNVADEQPVQDIEETNRKLRILEVEWRERKSERLEKALHTAASQIEQLLEHDDKVSVEMNDRTVVVRVGEDRQLRLSLRLNFDDGTAPDSDYRVQDKEIRRRPDYEEVDSEHIFETLDQAVSFVMSQCQ